MCAWPAGPACPAGSRRSRGAAPPPRPGARAWRPGARASRPGARAWLPGQLPRSRAPPLAALARRRPAARPCRTPGRIRTGGAMGKVYAGLDDRLRQFISAQHVFFVATAPAGGGHVNLSPKGYRDTFAVLGPRTVAYLDLTGSGAETIAHLRQNGRITIMFCSFAETPMVLRLQGAGRAVLPGQTDWAALAGCFPRVAARDAGRDGHRAIIVAELDRIASSCGYSVPVMEL